MGIPANRERVEAQAGPDLANARRWVAVAIGSLVVAGGFALVLVIGRTPPFAHLFPDAHFFKRCLVVHVDCALVIWFYAYVAGLFHLLPGPTHGVAGRVGSWVSLLGLVGMMSAATQPGAEPVLANYVPMIDHPLFVVGLLLFAVGVALAVLEARLLPAPGAPAGAGLLPPAAHPFLRAAALAFVIALTCFWGAWVGTPRDLPASSYYEIVMWGGGHVLQFASVAAMLAVWLWLLSPLVGDAPILSACGARWLAALLVLPLLAAPVLGLRGTTSGFYRQSFTRLMEFAIFPVVTIVLLQSVRALVRARRAGTLPRGGWRDWRLVSFAVSAALTVTGFLLGAAITGPNTMVPAHYHAAIGAVTAAFMASTYLLLAPFGMPLRGGWFERLAAWQVPLYGVGQLVFTLGFGMAGTHGAARKAYGQEQVVRTLGEYVGLGVMGLGGAVAAVGGLLFLGLIVVAGYQRGVRRPATVVAASAQQGEVYGR